MNKYHSFYIIIIALVTLLTSYAIIKYNLTISSEILNVQVIKDGKKKRFINLDKTCSVLNFYTDVNENCKNSSKKYNILIIGNSHEPDGLNQLLRITEDRKNINLIIFGTTNKCDFKVLNNEVYSESNIRNCNERFENLNLMINQNKITDVFYSANRPFAKNNESFFELFKFISEKNKNVRFFINGGFINNKIPCPEIINENLNYNSCFRKEYISYLPLSEYSTYYNLNYIYLDRMKYMCSKEENLELNCITQIIKKNKIVPYSYDQHHLSLEYAQLIGEKMKDDFLKYFE